MIEKINLTDLKKGLNPFYEKCLTTITERLVIMDYNNSVNFLKSIVEGNVKYYIGENYRSLLTLFLVDHIKTKQVLFTPEEKAIAINALGKTNDKDIYSYLKKMYRVRTKENKRAQMTDAYDCTFTDYWTLQEHIYDNAPKELGLNFTISLSYSSSSDGHEINCSKEEIQKQMNENLNKPIHKSFRSAIKNLESSLGIQEEI